MLSVSGEYLSMSMKHPKIILHFVLEVITYEFILYRSSEVVRVTALEKFL